MTLDAAAAQDEATQLKESARTHKRSAGFHRRRARECMQKLDELRAQCAHFGISLHIDEAPEAVSHDQPERT